MIFSYLTQVLQKRNSFFVISAKPKAEIKNGALPNIHL